MAKQKYLIEDTEKVWVESRTYKGHWRAKRGSKTAAKLNTALQKSTEDLKIANKAAQLIKASLDPFRRNFMGGQLWQVLVKKFRQQIQKGEEFHTRDLKNLEIWVRYPLSRFGASFIPEVEMNTSSLRVTLKRYHHPDFKRTFTDSYRISMLAIFPDFIKMGAHDEGCIADVVYMQNAVENMVFNFPIPEDAIHYLIILKVEGTTKGVISDNVTIKAMQIIDAGRLS